jgi:hypothetical protein
MRHQIERGKIERRDGRLIIIPDQPRAPLDILRVYMPQWHEIRQKNDRLEYTPIRKFVQSLDTEFLHQRVVFVRDNRRGDRTLAWGFEHTYNASLKKTAGP